jgi:hypothetical protein
MAGWQYQPKQAGGEWRVSDDGISTRNRRDREEIKPGKASKKTQRLGQEQQVLNGLILMPIRASCRVRRPVELLTMQIKGHHDWIK